MRALTIPQAIELSEAWKALGTQTLFAVQKGREFLVEGPEDRQDRRDIEEPEEEAVLRIFTDSEDAWLWAEEQEEHYSETRLRVASFDLKRLFDLKHLVANNAFADFGVTVRADVCVLRNGEPRVVDTLWSSNIQPN